MLLSVLVAAASAYAHFAVSRQSMRVLIADADLVVHARLLEVDQLVETVGRDSWERQALRALVLDVIKGPAKTGESLRFLQHGHGAPRYREGDEVLLFLRKLSRSAELSGLASSDGLQWYSRQEQNDAYDLAPSVRETTVAAARTYAAIESMPPDRQTQALHEITVKLLRSKDPRLWRSALRDLAAKPETIPVTSRDVPRLLHVVDDAQRSIQLRIGLLIELDRRGLVESKSRWVQWLQTSPQADRLAVIEAAGLHPSPAVRAELVRILKGTDMALGAAAAVALGFPGHNEAIEPLSETLLSTDARLAMAAIRGLGNIGTPEAAQALRAAAESHPDPKVQRRAQAELRLLDSRRIR